MSGLLTRFGWLVIGWLAVAGSLSRGDWPQWRGPHRDGVVAAFQTPRPWPKRLERVWQVPVGSGHSSPVVVGQWVYVFTRRDDNETIACLSAVDGSTKWEKSYPAPYEVHPSAIAHGKGPKSTPAVADGKVFTFGISGILTCWNAESGEQLWQREFSKHFAATSPHYGAATSPLIVDNKCIVYVGGHDEGSLMAFNVETGKTKWYLDEDGPAYASPVVATISDVRQVITQSQTACIGVDLRDGELLWKIPFKTDYDQNSVTPVVYEDSIIVSGFNRGVERFSIEKADGQWHTNKSGENNEVAAYMCTPVVSGDRLYGFSQRQKGQLFCLDLTSWQKLWVSQERMGESASIVRSGDVLWALTTRSELIAFRDTAKKYEPLAMYKVADTPVWAHPVLLPDAILVKDESTLARWVFPATDDPSSSTTAQSSKEGPPGGAPATPR